jgi:ferredoxin
MGGSCGTCRVTVVSGSEHVDPKDPGEHYHIPGGDESQRLACQMICRGTGDVEITQPGRGAPIR